MRSGFTKLGVESLETRDNPSSLSDLWDGVIYYGGAALEGLYEGGENVIQGGWDALKEVKRTAVDLRTIWRDGDNLDPSAMTSKLFQGAAATAGDPAQAAAFDNQLVFGIVTLSVGPLGESGYDAVVNGNTAQFSQNAGGFGVMVLIPYAVAKGINALPPINLPVPSLTPGPALQTIGGPVVQLPGTVTWTWTTVGSITVSPATAAGIAAGGLLFSTRPGSGGTPGPTYSTFEDGAGVDPGTVDPLDYIGPTQNQAWSSAGFTEA